MPRRLSSRELGNSGGDNRPCSTCRGAAEPNQHYDIISVPALLAYGDGTMELACGRAHEHELVRLIFGYMRRGMADRVPSV